MQNISNIAIIIARKGSRRIKNKNIINFFGKPIIFYSIYQAKKTRLFDKIIISTDSKKIKRIAEKYGAISYGLRPKKMSQDCISTIDVISYELKNLLKRKIKPVNVCCIYPAAPLISHKDIKIAYKMIKNNNFNYVFSAGAYQSFSANSFKKTGNKNKIKLLFNSKQRGNIKTMDKVYYDAAQFYWGKYSAWIKKKKIFSESSAFVEVKRYRLQDINTYEDLTFAKKLFKIT